MTEATARPWPPLVGGVNLIVRHMRHGEAVRLVTAIVALVLALAGPGRSLAWAGDASDEPSSQVAGQLAAVGSASTRGEQGTSAPSGDPALAAREDAAASADASHPSSAWPQFRGTGATGATTAANPTVGGRLAWSSTPDGVVGFSNRTDPIIVGDALYMAEGQRDGAVLYRVSLADGTVSGGLALAAPIDSTSRAVYSQDSGLMFVPLRGGQVQAVRVGDGGLETAWVSEPIDNDEQTLTTPLLSGGRLFLGTTDGGSPSRKGHLVCLDAATGRVVWSISQGADGKGVGYYWTGAAMTSRGLLMGDDAGNLTLRSPNDGSEIAHVNLGGAIRSTIVLSQDGSTAYAVTRDDGTLHAVDVASMAQVGSVRFCDYSTSTPTVVDGVAYVGGRVGRSGGIFAVDVSDPTSLQVRASATSLQTGATVGEVKSAPLVSVRGGETYVYFTANSEPGAIYVYRAGESGFRLLFAPKLSQYCFSSVICDAEGNLYYTNDSSALFKVAASDEPVAQPEAAEGEGAGDGAKSDEAAVAARDGGFGTASSGAHAGVRPGDAGAGGPGSSSSGAAVTGSDDAGTSVGAASSGAGASRGGRSGQDATGREPAGTMGGASNVAGTGGSGDLRESDDDARDGDSAAPGDAASSANAGESGSSQEGNNPAAPPGQARGPARAVPVWPIVGMCAGVAVIVLALAWPRLSERWRSHGRQA